MADSTITNLTELTTLTGTDVFPLDTVIGTAVTRKMQASNMKPYLGDGWLDQTGWSYASASTINVPSNATLTIQKGDKVRWKQGAGYKYGVITAVTATLVTIAVNTDYTVANSAITDVAISRMESPFGFPARFNFTPVYTSGTGTLTTVTSDSATFTCFGTVALIRVRSTIINKGTAGDEFRYTIPFTSSNSAVGAGRDNFVSGFMLQVFLDSTNIVRIVNYAGGTVIATNAEIHSTIMVSW